MIPSEFNYHRPTSLDEALSLLTEHGDEAKLLSGGHSLLPTMKLRFSSPGVVIDIGRLQELIYIRQQDDILHIGAGTTHNMLAESDLVQAGASALAEAAGVIGDPQVRNMGTIGGSLAHADPAADYPAPILALDASIVVRGPKGERTIAAIDFFQDLYTTDLAEDEILTEIRVPVQKGRSSYLKFPHPASRFAVVGCAVSLRLDGDICRDVTVAFTGITNAAFLDRGVAAALEGKAANEVNIGAAASEAATSAEINGDDFADEEFRLHLAGVFAKRAISRAAGL